MDSFNRLHLLARATYYLAWILALCGGVAHYSLKVTALFTAISLPQRNLFEGSLLLFVICAASDLRAFVCMSSKEPSPAKKQAA